MADSFEVQCPECLTKVRLRDRQMLGKKGKCPKCSEKFILSEYREEEIVPEVIEDEFGDLTGPVSEDFDEEEFADEDSVDDEDFEPAPKKKSRQKNDVPGKKSKGKKTTKSDSPPMALLAGLGVIGVAILTGVIWLASGMLGGGGGGSVTPLDPAWLPKDLEGVAMYRIDAGLDKGSVQESMLTAAMVESMGKHLPIQIGLAPDKVRQLTLAYGTETRMLILRGVTPFPDDFKAKYLQTNPEKVQDLDLHKIDDRHVACFPDEKTFVIGDSALVKAGIEDTKAKAHGDRWDWVDAGGLFVIFAPQSTGTWPASMINPTNPDGLASMALPNTTCQGLAFSATVGSSTSYTFTARFADASEAKAGSAAVHEFFVAAVDRNQKSTAKTIVGSGIELDKIEQQSIPDLEALPKSVKTSTNGNAVRSHVTVPASVLKFYEKLFKELS